MTEQDRAQKCINNKDTYLVCFNCANKYSKNKPYNDVLTMRNSECYICQQHKMVGPSYKLFGHYKRNF